MNNTDVLTFSCTLNRAHKLADRVRQMLNEESEKARAMFAVVSLQGYGGEAQVRSLREHAGKGSAALERHRALNEALRLIRDAIGRANVSAGVHERLVEQDALNRRLQLLRQLVNARPATAIEVFSLENYQPYSKNESMLRSPTVTVATMDAPTLFSIQAEIAATEKALYALSDAIAECNLRKVTISIDAQLASEIGVVSQ